MQEDTFYRLWPLKTFHILNVVYFILTFDITLSMIEDMGDINQY
jgi:hypothetical protein